MHNMAKEKITKKAAKVEAAKAKAISAKVLRVIVGPVVSEKAASQSDHNRITLLVHPNANKVQVKQAINELYGVIPDRVNIMNVRGPRVRFGRFLGKRSDTKKAIITLPKGSSVDIFEGV